MDMDKYTRKSLEVIEKAKDKALEYDNQELAQIHLLAGLLEIDESLISKIFEKLDIDVTAAVNRVEDKLASLPKVSGGNLYAGNNFSKALIQAEKDILGNIIIRDDKGAEEMARRSRGTPRLANRLLKRVRDFAQVKYDGVITEDVANTALNLLEVDKLGLDRGDRSILDTIISKFAGGPVGLDTLAAALGEDSGTLEDVYEPYLIQNGLIQRTPRGRIATPTAYEHLGIPYEQ